MVAQSLRDMIINGELLPGSQLPNELDLAEQLGVSRTTLRVALNLLENQGFLYKRHGVGTFVQERPLLVNNLSLNFGVTELLQSLGYEPGCSHLEITAQKSTAQQSNLLSIGKGEEVVAVKRVRTANGEPIIYSEDFFPVTLLERLGPNGNLDALRKLIEEHMSMYTLLEGFMGLHLAHGIATLEPRVADERLMSILELTEHCPVLLLIQQVDYNDENEPVIMTDEYHSAGAFRFSVFRQR
jgi:GntR family transcriptional regulator